MDSTKVPTIKTLFIAQNVYLVVHYKFMHYINHFRFAIQNRQWPLLLLSFEGESVLVLLCSINAGDCLNNCICQSSRLLIVKFNLKGSVQLNSTKYNPGANRKPIVRFWWKFVCNIKLTIGWCTASFVDLEQFLISDFHETSINFS